MEFTEFVNELEVLANQIKTLVDAEMIRKGDTPDECQLICVFDKVSELEHAISGIEADDMQ